MSEILAPHDDGHWWRATLLAQYRSTLEPGRWNVTVRYSVEVGAQYQRTLWADDCRAVDSPPPGCSDPRASVRGRIAPWEVRAADPGV